MLESSATRRDAKGYLQKYAGSDKLAPRPQVDALQFVQGSQRESPPPALNEPCNAAIVTLRTPQQLPNDTIRGIAKTLSQLHALGLLAIVIVDCGADATRQTFQDEALRLCEALDSSLGHSVAKLAGNMFARQPPRGPTTSSIFSDTVRVDDQGLLQRALQHGIMVVAPCLARRDDISEPQPAEAHETVLALTKFLNGMQFQNPFDDLAGDNRPKKIASVERLIVLDPLGGIPIPSRPNLCHRLISLEQEYSALMHNLATRHAPATAQVSDNRGQEATHEANLKLAKHVLSLLPPSSSALVTTPQAAANMRSHSTLAAPADALVIHPSFNLAEMVTTRRQQNPLLHNLLTDRPASSPSLPLQKVKDEVVSQVQVTNSGEATLIKRGMPVTIYPDPRVCSWRPPKPGSSRLRLTDTCIDLPRLTHLIEDSFNRKLDVQAYLDRVNDNLAGIIIAGEYQGGAICTWERPAGMGEREAFDSRRLVPYLDKFAVLRARQGSGGVADIVFNAMVQDCFPRGVCWRSREDNPVNKWYFERSAGTCKLPNSGWTMFWTTLGLSSKHPVLVDYKTVCRSVQPTWADNKHILE